MADANSKDVPLPSPPFIAVPGLPNFRDIGGLPIASQSGKLIRKGIVFRASEPSKIRHEGISVLNSLGITTVYDLRSTPEIKKSGLSVREWPGAERHFVPVFLEEDYRPEILAQRFQHYSRGDPEV
jgi:hypothetical protein